MRKTITCCGLILSLGLLRTGSSYGQITFDKAVKEVAVRIVPSEAKPGQTVTIELRMEVNPGYHTYPTVQPDPEWKTQVNRFKLPKPNPQGLIFVGKPIDPPEVKTKVYALENRQAVQHQYTGSPTWKIHAVVSPDAKPGKLEQKLDGFARLLVCDDMACAPPRTISPTVTLTILDGPAMAVEDAWKAEVEQALGRSLGNGSAVPNPNPTQVGKTPLPPCDPPTASTGETEKNVGLKFLPGANITEDLEAVRKQLPKPTSTNAGLVTFLLTAAFWGLVTLLTPCVFPMIPITVSYFLKQGEKKHHSPLMMSLIYTGTIITVLSVSAIALLSTFRSLSVDPWMNVALGLLFVFFALSLFGMYDIQMPQWLQQYTSTKATQGGILGTIFMAISFTIVSFTCVAPFLGGFSGMAASGNFSQLELALGGLVFATTFAAPFFLLSLFPSMLKQLPKSGSWMDTIKVVMGFLELAAALKFFRNAELRWQIPPAIFSYDLVLGLWIAMLCVCALYLLGMFRMPHDEPHEHIGVLRMNFGILALGIALYLLPALFATNSIGERQRPRGTLYAWVDAFLLPEPSAADTSVNAQGELIWSSDLRRAIEDARKKQQLVFLDFTGVTCTNCKLNEKNVFVKEKIKNLMKPYHLVQLYTDTVPESFYELPPDDAQRDQDAAAILAFQKAAFGNEQLPLYVILEPLPNHTIRVLGIYDEGKINNEDAFIRFLKKPFEQGGRSGSATP